MNNFSFKIKKCKYKKRPAIRAVATCNTTGMQAKDILFSDTDSYECVETTAKVYALYDLFVKLEKKITRDEANLIVQQTAKASV